MDGKLSFTGDTAKAMTLQQLQGELARCYRAAREEVGDPGDLAARPRRAAAAAAPARSRPTTRAASSIQVVNELYAQQLITATGGNVSVRDPGPRRALDHAEPALQGRPAARDAGAHRPRGPAARRGARAPSSERLMHCAIYRARPEAQAVIHAHAPHATILANTDLPFLPISTEAAFFGNIPRVPFIMPGTEALAKAVGEAAASGVGGADEEPRPDRRRPQPAPRRRHGRDRRAHRRGDPRLLRRRPRAAASSRRTPSRTLRKMGDLIA